MRDFLRLREQLRVALLCGPLAIAGCGTSSPPPQEPPISNGTDDPGDPPPAREVPFPTYEGSCGQGGSWCGPQTQAAKQQRETQGTGINSCPTEFRHADLYFNLDEDATRQGQAGNCCYWYSDGCVIGRPLLDRGAPQVASVRDGAWSRDAFAPVAALPVALREALARGWLEDALLEHASVASFARATLELMAVGAPAELLADCQRAGLDEVRHAEGCFALAARYGRARAPGPIAALPARPAGLARLAVDTFVEGCVAETVATLAGTRVLASCRDPEVARFLARIVRDETRHAALAWRTVAWAAREGGAEVAGALRAAAVPPRFSDEGDAEPALLAYGRLDERTRRAAAVDAWREIIGPTLAEILAAS